jgi:hypothetical protein
MSEIINITNHEYMKKWRIENPEKLKRCRDNWYYANKDNEDFKNKKSEYQKQYYARRKLEKQAVLTV